MRYASVCSGIEAASLAWEGNPVNWEPVFFSELEPFPCAVLAHHWPQVPNLGDMTKIDGKQWRGQVDVLVGGTPCQAFSVAGMRHGLNDERGNLTLVFAELANDILPSFVVWENVPGVLSDKTNAFGCLLGALAGEDAPLVPPGGKWTNAGYVLGPQRAIAWIVKDAQYFGVAQRRRRVFLVACPRNGADPRAVLFEREGVRRDSAPRREAGKEVTGSLAARTRGGGDLGTDFDCDGGVIPILEVGARTGASTNDPRAGMGVGAKTDPMFTLQSGKQHGVLAFGGNNTKGPIDVATARSSSSSSPHGRLDFESETFCVTTPVAFDTTQITSAANRSNPHPGDPCHPLAAGAHAPAIAFQTRGSNIDFGRDASGTLGSNCDRASGSAPCVAFPANLSGTQCASAEDICPSMGAQNPTAVAFEARFVRTTGGQPSEELNPCLRADANSGDGAPCVAYSTKLHNTSSNQSGKLYEEYTVGLDVNSPPPALLTTLQVRRLTPRECERLQGMPDDHTLIPWRIWKSLGKHPMVASYEAELHKRGMRLREPTTEECPDGPRYKAIGNSMAVPCMRWIGQRINMVIAQKESRKCA